MKYDNNILLDLFNGVETSRPPVWVMRQAGRILPGYRSIRASVSGFKELVKTPELISQVTIEPLEVLGVDAAILFSDILVIPEAMGIDYEIVEKKGPVFSTRIEHPSDVDQLISGEAVLDQLSYVFESIDQTKRAIDNRNPLIGFAGAPWTLFAYMIEGSGSKTFAKARRFLYEHPASSKKLLRMISDSTIYYIKEKIARGCDVIQLFDSWAEMLPVDQYIEFCLPEVSRILAAVEGTPRIFFPKGAWSVMPLMKKLPCEAISIDWKTPMPYVRDIFGDQMIIQGNIDPASLYAPEERIATLVRDTIGNAGGRHIFNLGHGVYPDTDRNKVRFMVEQIKNYSLN